MLTFTRRTLGAAALALAAPFAAAQSGGPIKVGLLLIDSGPFATYAGLMESGAKAAVEMLNAEGGALGRKFELVTQAHSGTPAAAMAAATKLAQQGGVSMILGQTQSSHSLALVPKLESLNVIQIDHYAQSNDLMTKSCAPNYFRINTPDAVSTRMMQDFVKASGMKSWNLISVDYSAGQSFAKAFGDLAGGMGGSVQQSLFAPQGTTDFGSFITQLSKPADGLVVTLYMSDGQSFAKQSRQFGLFDKYKMVLGNGFATDFQLEAHGDNVLGVFNTLSWTPELPGARNEKYVKDFERIAKRRPFYTDADVMVALEVYRAGVIKAGATDPAKVRKALEGLKIDTLFGPGIEMRAADHHLIRQHGMAQVVKGPGGKNVFVMRVVKPGAEIYPPPSPECKAS
ncbi:MAG TPA: ABC transporter substrate-binding protein [Rubrivivax sp.]|mgnify:CR=1 FL=1|nr:ABC transporter substrate-binding protein [Rubrivivax sp.]